MKPESSKAVTQGFRRNQWAGGHCIVHFPVPDYSKIPPKVDTWRKKPKIDGSDKKVGGAVTMRDSDVSEKTAWYQLEGLIPFASDWINVYFMVISLKSLNHVKFNCWLIISKKNVVIF
jgi:hypothetical protein